MTSYNAAMVRLLKQHGLLILFGVLLTAVLGFYLFRAEVLESFLVRQLNKYGLPLHTLQVEEFSFNTLRVQDVNMGSHQELSIRKIDVAWQLTELLSGQPIAIDIDGLHVKLDLSGESPFRSTLGTSSSGNVSLPWLPVVSLKNSAIHLRTNAGDMKVALTGHISQPQSGRQDLRLRAIADSTLGQVDIELTGNVTPQGQGQARILLREGSLDLPAAKISHFSGESNGVLEAFKLQDLGIDFVSSAIKIADVGSSIQQKVKISLELATIDQVTLRGFLRNSDGWKGELDVNVHNVPSNTETFGVGNLSIAVPVKVHNQQDNWQVGLRDSAQIIIGKLNYGAKANLKKAVSFSVSQADLGLTKKPQGWQFDHVIAINASDLNLSVNKEESAPFEVHIQPGKVLLNGRLDSDRNYKGRFTLNEAALLLPQSDLSLKAVSVDAQFGDATRNDIARFTIGQVQHQAQQAFFKTLSVFGNLETQRIGGRPLTYVLAVTAGVQDLRYLKLTAEHAPEKGDGNLTVQLTPLRFKPQGLQPRALFPVLEAFENVMGSVDANARIDWKKSGISQSHGKFELQGISFTHEAATVNDLHAMLSLNDLTTFGSPPGQRITARRIDPGVPIENLHITYQIKPAKIPRLALEGMHFSVMDGIVSLAPTVINPAASRSDLKVHIDRIDLATFFNVINVKGLTGSGRLSGDIPIALEKKRVLIQNGHLAAESPGILHFQSEKAAQFLAGAGEEMNLLLQALQNFHYSELSLNLDKSLEQDLIAKLSLLGNNPEIKEGRPFRLNIKLETDIDKILDTINHGYNMSHEILRGSFKLN